MNDSEMAQVRLRCAELVINAYIVLNKDYDVDHIIEESYKLADFAVNNKKPE